MNRLSRRKTAYEKTYKKYTPQPFESVATGTGHATFTDFNGTKRVDTFTRVYKSMLLSTAFQTLTEKQKVLYFYVKSEYYGSRKPKQDFEELELFQDDDLFYFNLGLAKQYGLYKDSTKKNFYSDMGKLVTHGLIEKVSAGKFKKKNIYRYSSKWQTWEQK